MNQRVTLLADETGLEGEQFSAVVSDSLPSLPQSVKAILAKTSTQNFPDDDVNLSLWHQILQTASFCTDVYHFMHEVVKALGEAFQVDGCLILLPQKQLVGWHLHLEQSIQISADTAFPEGLEYAEPIAFSPEQNDLASSSSQFVRGLTEIWQSFVVSQALPTPGTIVGSMTQFQETVNGVISLTRSHLHPWTTTEIEGLRTVSHQVAMAVAHFELQEQIKRQQQYQSVVNQLTMAIRNAADLPEILSLATEGTARALQVQRGLLLQLKYSDPLFKSRFQGQSSKVRAIVTCEWQANPSSPSQPSLDGVLNQSFWLSECALCQSVLNQPAFPISASNRQQLPKFDPAAGIASVFNLEELPAMLLFPLESQGTVLGFLAFQDDCSHVWQPEEMELVKLVSAQVGTAIIQTETLRQVQALVEKRTAELQQSLAIQAKLYERTRQQLEQLRQLNQLKDEFLSTVSHELRTPLTSMTMAIKMLRQVGVSSDRSARYLDILEQQCAQETSLINDLLALQELESKQVSIQVGEIDLADLISDVARIFSQKWSDKGVNLVLNLADRPLRLYSDRESLHRILLELLTNAGKYSEPNSQVQLDVSYEPGQPTGRFILKLTNVGSGISPDELPHIFEKFRRCQRANQNAVQGTGLGLALVKSLVQLLEGTIEVSSCSTDAAETCETSFTLVLPQSLDISGL